MYPKFLLIIPKPPMGGRYVVAINFISNIKQNKLEPQFYCIIIGYAYINKTKIKEKKFEN